MRKVILAAVCALAAAATTLVPAGPAQAFGWSPKRCYEANAGTACVEVYSQPFQNGLIVTNVRVCLATAGGSGNASALRDSRITFNNGATNLNNPTATSGCRSTPYQSPKNGLQACFHFYTYFVVNPGTDPSGDVHGKITNGTLPCG